MYAVLGISNIEKDALMDLYESTNGANWNNDCYWNRSKLM